jgi:endonuclease/exonuclease/phosphatase family metal-dependent hydrolase
MTYNLGYLSGMTNNLPVKPAKGLFEDNLTKSKALIDELQPDVIGFQEIDFASSRSYQVNQLESLSQGYQAAVKSVNWDKKYVPFPYWPPSTHFGRLQSGQALLSKFPISWSKRIVLSTPKKAPFYYQAFYLDRLIQVAELKIKDHSVIILNVHLEAFDQETREIQAGEVLNVIEQYINTYPVILIGDFNARPPFASDQVSKESTISIFIQHPLLSQALSRNNYLAHEEDHFTFDTAAPYEKLDYIFYSHQSIQLVNVSTVTEASDISDHFPLLMSFTMRTD